MLEETNRHEPRESNIVKSSVVNVGSVTIGAQPFVVAAGPCSIESYQQFHETAQSVLQNGASFLRGGVYKMRTNPQSFQGLGDTALEIAQQVKKECGSVVVSEVTDPRQIENFIGKVDMFQVGSRNMYNYALLKELAQVPVPVLLKRGFSATVSEWILAAEYIVKGGNRNVVLCERGIRTFETVTRNTLDLASVAYLKQNTSFPVMVDPSHATGVPSLIGPMAKAAAAAGADGVIVEVHPHPKSALSDGHQALDFVAFQKLMRELRPVLNAIDRPLWGEH